MNTSHIIILVGIPLVAITTFLISMVNGDTDPLPIKLDTIYQTAGTIMSLAIFGSVVSVLIHSKIKCDKKARYGAMVVSASTIIVATIQSLVMLHACCMGFDKWWFGVSIVATFVACVMIVIGIAAIVGSRSTFESNKL